MRHESFNEQNKLEGINREILNNLKSDQAVWGKFNLHLVDRKLTRFLSESDLERKGQLAISIVQDVLGEHGKATFATQMRELAKIEPAVQRFYPGLRDHVAHSVYTFVLGLHLSSNLSQIKIDPLSWKLTALLHDIGYPVELFTRSIGGYLEDVYSLIKSTAENIQTSKVLGYSIDIHDFEEMVSGRRAFELINNRLADWGLKADLHEIFSKKMTKGVVDHGILSALVVLNVIDAIYHKINPQNLKKFIHSDGLDYGIEWYYGPNLDAVSAIAVHNLKADDLGTKICFEKAPLLYLLVLCDLLQIWDRYSHGRRGCKPNQIKLQFEKGVECSFSRLSDLKKVQEEITKKLRASEILPRLTHLIQQ